jgi:hypothetical protein
MDNPIQEDEFLFTLGAQALARMWLAGKDIASAMANPVTEAQIVEVARQLTDTGHQDEWIAFVRGDGKDARMAALADRCVEAARQLNESLKAP